MLQTLGALPRPASGASGPDPALPPGRPRNLSQEHLLSVVSRFCVTPVWSSFERIFSNHQTHLSLVYSLPFERASRRAPCIYYISDSFEARTPRQDGATRPCRTCSRTERGMNEMKFFGKKHVSWSSSFVPYSWFSQLRPCPRPFVQYVYTHILSTSFSSRCMLLGCMSMGVGNSFAYD